MIKNGEIIKANPWWKAKENINADGKLAQWDESFIRYDPQLRHQIKYDFEPNNTVIYTVRGPRQVGKTTMIKLQIRDFITRMRVNPWNIFYYSFDLTRTKNEMVEVIEAYLKTSRNYKVKSDRTYMFLDEITSVGDWQKGVKWLVDADRLEHCTILATGSQATSILHGAERLPGRRGRITDPYDRVLAPMRFSEFAFIRDEEIRKFMQKHNLLEFQNKRRGVLQLSAKEVPEYVDLLHSTFADRLDEYLHEYLLTGGTPKVVDEKVRTNFIPSEIYLSYLDGIQGDWGMSKNHALLRQITGAIIQCAGSSISWNALRKNAELSVGSTAQDYAWLLNDLSLAYVIHRYGEKKKIPLLSKEKKIYFRDPFFTHIFNWWHGEEDPLEASEAFLADSTNLGTMAEGVVADHLVRLAFDLAENKQNFDYVNRVFYWKDQNGREVDFVIYRSKKSEIPIEVKYRNSVDHRDLGGMTHFLDKTGVKTGIVLTKNELDSRTDYVMIPTPIFLMLV